MARTPYAVRLSRARSSMVSKVLNTYGHVLIGGAVLEPFAKADEHRDWAVTAIVIAAGLALHLVAYNLSVPTAGDDDE